MSDCEPCKTNSCAAEDDFGVYSLQDTAQFPTAMGDGAACEACKTTPCPEVPPDFETYDLQANIVFNGTPITVVVECPEGYDCGPGWPVTVIYPPGTFVIPDPTGTDSDGNPIYTVQGCLSPVSGIDLNAVLAEVARQQAICDTNDDPPGGGGGTTPSGGSYKNDTVYFAISCVSPEVPKFTGTPPAWVTWDDAHSRLVGAAGTYVSTVSKADATATAQAEINSIGAAFHANDELKCFAPFENTLQCVDCGTGYFDTNQYNEAIDENGIYVVDGIVCASTGYYTSLVSQEDADAQALAAAQAKFDSLVAGAQIVCYTCGFTTEYTSDNPAGWVWADRTSCSAYIPEGHTVETMANGRLHLLVSHKNSGTHTYGYGAEIEIYNNSAVTKKLSLDIAYDLFVTDSTTPIGLVSFYGEYSVLDQDGSGYTGPLPAPAGNFTQTIHGAYPAENSLVGNTIIDMEVAQTGGTGGRQCRKVTIFVCAYIFAGWGTGDPANYVDVQITPTWSDIP